MISHKIRKYFDFLLKCGFKLEKNDNGIDYEYNYRKSDIEIFIFYGVGISSEPYFKNNNYYECPPNVNFGKIDKEANIQYLFYITITKGGKQSNILDCNFFDELSLNVLKNDIINCKGNVEQLFDIYSTFLKENIKQLM